MTRAPEPSGLLLVLGGTGFLGGQIVSHLDEHGYRVRSLSRRAPEAGLAACWRGVEVVEGDASDPSILGEALDGVTHVVDALGAAYPAESALAPTADVLGTLPTLIGLLEALSLRPGIPLTFLSSGGTVYGNPRSLPVPESAACDPTTSYGITRLAAEKYVGMYAAQHGVPARVLRVANAYGPRQQIGRGQGAVAAFLDAAARGGAVRLFGDGLTVRDYVHVADVAESVRLLMDRPERHLVVNVGTGIGHSLLDVLAIVSEVTGVTPPVEHVPARAFDVDHIVLDTTRIRQLAPGWAPVRLAEGIRSTWAERAASLTP